MGHAIALRAQLPQQFAQVPDATLFPAIVDQLIEQELLAQSQTGALSARDQVMLENETRNFLANAALVRAVSAAVTEETIAAAYLAYSAENDAGEPVTEYPRRAYPRDHRRRGRQPSPRRWPRDAPSPRSRRNSRSTDRRRTAAIWAGSGPT